ncbi:ATP-binding protein [Cupriavidus sp. 2SB]|uniref:sensor histidine kinase n=1 Tax=Cupriavidus sp. 2SB TaxID=2502199 RepID=UPI0010F77341|nr:ATP-binding protein [Cupriavidus sp. 2SB]
MPAMQPEHVNRLGILGRSVAMIVHEAMQPMASVVTRGQAALRWMRQDTPDTAAAIASLERMVSDAQRAAAVLAELRSLASPPSVAARPRERLPLNGLLRDTVRWFDEELRRQQVRLQVDLPPDDVCVTADRTALRQVFLNLLLNALEAMADCPADARAVSVTLAVMDGSAEVAIVDAGCGIAPDAADTLFRAFYTTKRDGMGMGLAICHRIVTTHGGSIHAESQPGGGARFVVRLPLGSTPSDPHHDPDAPQAAS